MPDKQPGDLLDLLLSRLKSHGLAFRIEHFLEGTGELQIVVDAAPLPFALPVGTEIVPPLVRVITVRKDEPNGTADAEEAALIPGRLSAGQAGELLLCDECGSAFVPSRSTQRKCSVACRRRYQNAYKVRKKAAFASTAGQAAPAPKASE